MTDLNVNRPFADHSAVVGRATRAYLAYDVAEKRLIFLKDTWRIADFDLQVEYKTYQLLQEHEVPNVPAILYGGDVTDSQGQVQETLTQRVAADGAEWRFGVSSFEKHVHHRIVQHIAYPLESVLDEQELVQALYDVLCGESGLTC